MWNKFGQAIALALANFYWMQNYLWQQRQKLGNSAVGSLPAEEGMQSSLCLISGICDFIKEF